MSFPIRDVCMDDSPLAFGPGDDAAVKARKLDSFRAADLHLMGRATYEEMAGFWPTSDDEYAAPMNDIPKVVFSKTLPLFAGLTAPIVLDLIEARAYGDGAVLHVYRPAT